MQKTIEGAQISQNPTATEESLALSRSGLYMS